jgi:hypothetical protein
MSSLIMNQSSSIPLADVSSYIAQYLTLGGETLPCIYYMFSFLTVVFPFITAEEDAKQAGSDLNEIRKITIRWLSHPESINAFLQRSRRGCVCPVSSDRPNIIHTYGQEFGARLNTDYPGMCATLIRSLLKFLILPGLQFHAVHRIERLTRRKVWPTTLEDVLPHGPRETVHGVLAWLDLDFRGHKSLVLNVANVIAYFGYPVTLPYFVKSTTFIPRGILPTLQDACKIFEQITPHNTSLTTADHNAVEWCGRCSCVIMTLITACNDAERQEMMREHRSILLQLFIRVEEHLKVLHERFATDKAFLYRGWFMNMAAALVSDYPDLKDTISISPDIARMSQSDQENLWVRMLDAIVHIAQASRCARPECTHTFADAVVHKRCGGCCRVVYCSRECQKTAWQHPVVPHRHICATLREMCLLYQLDSPARMKIKQTVQEPASFDRISAQMLIDHFLEHGVCELKATGA